MSKGDDYAVTELDRSRRYNDAYRAWVEALSPAERQKLGELGVHRPDDGRYIEPVGRVDIGALHERLDADDASADSQTTSALAAPAPDFDAEPAPDPEHADHWRELSGVLVDLLDADDARYAANIAAMAAGLEGMLPGLSVSDIARKWAAPAPRVAAEIGLARARVEAAAPASGPDWSSLRLTLTLILEQPNARMSVEALVLASGLGALIGSPGQADLARAHGCTRAAISKRVKVFSERLNLRPTGGMRPLEICQKYREARLRVYVANQATARPLRQSA